MSDNRRKKSNGSGKSPPELIVPYTVEESNIFGSVLRPRVKISLYSRVLSTWITIDDVLADTGADLSLLPKSLGILIVGNIRQGKRYRMSGLISEKVRYFYLHPIKVKLGKRKFESIFAIGARDDIPPTLGRSTALDKMNIAYQKGRQLAISW